ncbi:substrate-binding domain-containing protein [Paenarthrobacter ureafaciens]
MRLLDGVVPAERPTAIMCANDRLAVGVVLAAARLGLSIPGDLSVMGYDDEHRIANTMVPALTTMALPPARDWPRSDDQACWTRSRTVKPRRRSPPLRRWSPAAWSCASPPDRQRARRTHSEARKAGHSEARNGNRRGPLN